MDIVDGWEAVGIAWGELRWEEVTYWEAELLARVFRTNSINDAIFPKNFACAQDFSSGVQRTCIASLAGRDTKHAQLLARFFQGKFHQYDCSKK